MLSRAAALFLVFNLLSSLVSFNAHAFFKGPGPCGSLLNGTEPRQLSLFEQSELSEVQKKYLENRYGISSDNVVLSPKTKTPVIFRMRGHDSLAPRMPARSPVRELKRYDVVVIGGGPAALTAALYLVEAGKSVLIVERNERLGGLAMGSELKGIRAAGGAAYSAGPDGGLEYEIFRKIGLGKYKQKIRITEPIDSYLWKGKLYRHVFSEHALESLPQSFRLFKHALLKLANEGAGQESGIYAEWADGMSMAELVRRMPELVKEWKDPTSIEILAKFINDKKLPKDPMKDVLVFLDLYGRSALGGTTEQISARQFIDFYESEIYTRYTGTLGTGTIAEHLLKKLSNYSHLVDIRTSSPVTSTENIEGGARTVFLQGDSAREVDSDYVIFGAPVSLAPRLIKNLESQDPEKVKTISNIKMTDYAVHVVRLKGHPYRATYDTWVYNNGDLTLPTDYILGRWQDPTINAYDGQQDFKKHPGDDYGVITIYHPLGLSNPKNFTPEHQLRLVDTAIQNLKERLSPLIKKDGQELKIELVESYRWPDSIHIVDPGYLKKTPILARPVGRIHFANNTVAAPELETAMARGAREALAIIAKEEKKKASNE